MTIFTCSGILPKLYPYLLLFWGLLQTTVQIQLVLRWSLCYLPPNMEARYMSAHLSLGNYAFCVGNECFWCCRQARLVLKTSMFGCRRQISDGGSEHILHWRQTCLVLETTRLVLDMNEIDSRGEHVWSWRWTCLAIKLNVFGAGDDWMHLALEMNEFSVGDEP